MYCLFFDVFEMILTRRCTITGKVVDEVKGDVAGLKSITMEFTGEYAHGWAQFETGIHRLVRCSPFDSAVCLVLRVRITLN